MTFFIAGGMLTELDFEVCKLTLEQFTWDSDA
jgi:hypothetical protein